jgi:hypothetical protein
MDAQDRAEFLAVLNQTRDDFLSSIAGVTDEQSRQKPDPDRWSILECAEHVVAAERIMYIMVTERCTPRTTPPTTREREIFARATDRSRKAVAPERVRPTGRIANLAEAAEKFREHRARSIELVNTCEKDLRALEIQHPMAGLVTAQECLAILAMHPGRHAAQIRELRQSLGIA